MKQLFKTGVDTAMYNSVTISDYNIREKFFHIAGR